MTNLWLEVPTLSTGHLKVPGYLKVLTNFGNRYLL